MKLSLLAAVFLLSLLGASKLRTIHGRKIVEYLPGFDGPLPFYLETGYIEVDEKQGVNLFYYFVKSEKNPDEDPLIYWIDGGPGCSSFNALGVEIGPIRFDSESYESGDIPKLNYWLDSWTRVGSVIFVDWPAGTGYSYARGDEMDGWSETKVVEFLYVFLIKWLVEHPEFLSNPLFVASESYGGKIMPIVTQKIIDGCRSISFDPETGLVAVTLAPSSLLHLHHTTGTSRLRQNSVGSQPSYVDGLKCFVMEPIGNRAESTSTKKPWENKDGLALLPESCGRAGQASRGCNQIPPSHPSSFPWHCSPVSRTTAAARPNTVKCTPGFLHILPQQHNPAPLSALRDFFLYCRSSTI